MSRLRFVFLLPCLSLLAGCNMVLLQPAGDVARGNRDVLVASTGLMLLIIIPVMVATIVIAWRYRHTNTAVRYEPKWNHSTGLEVAIWSAPLAIIVALGALTWVSTHLLDPYRPLSRLSAERPISSASPPLHIQVVALDWKWLFFYPDYGVATLNELAAPVDTPIDFKITSSHQMNSFFVPAIAGQIYAMPGMETPLHAVINKPGVFDGFSANYAGAGFSDMKFKVHGLSQADFQRWLGTVRSKGGVLDRAAYLRLEVPSEREPVRYFANVPGDLYSAALNQCVDRANMCTSEMMRLDAEASRPAPEAGAMAPATTMPGMDMPAIPADRSASHHHSVNPRD